MYPKNIFLLRCCWNILSSLNWFDVFENHKYKISPHRKATHCPLFFSLLLFQKYYLLFICSLCTAKVVFQLITPGHFWIGVIARTHSPAVNLMGGFRVVTRTDPGPTYSFMLAQCDVCTLWS